jgi:hypothetical protein
MLGSSQQFSNLGIDVTGAGTSLIKTGQKVGEDIMTVRSRLKMREREHKSRLRRSGLPQAPTIVKSSKMSLIIGMGVAFLGFIIMVVFMLSQTDSPSIPKGKRIRRIRKRRRKKSPI